MLQSQQMPDDWFQTKYLPRLRDRLEDPNLAFEVKADLKKRVGELESTAAPAPNLPPSPPRPPSPVDLEPPKLV